MLKHTTMCDTLWNIPYFASPFIASFCVRRGWQAVIVASAINVPVICLRLLWLESQLGNPPDYDIIFAIGLGLWSVATFGFNCLIIAGARATTRLLQTIR